MRNPVVDLATLIGVNDIPDWTYVESGMTFDPAKPPTPDAMVTFLSKSPITLVDKVSLCVRLCVCLRLKLKLQLFLCLCIHTCGHTHMKVSINWVNYPSSKFRTGQLGTHTNLIIIIRGTSPVAHPALFTDPLFN